MATRAELVEVTACDMHWEVLGGGVSLVSPTSIDLLARRISSSGNIDLINNLIKIIKI